MDDSAPVEGIDVAVYEVPTDGPESDGTLAWDSTTAVVVHARAGGCTGLGYTYASAATATVVRTTLAPLVAGSDAMCVKASWRAMVRAVRNLGRPGAAAMAISAVDIALWDLKARLLDLPLVVVLDAAHDRVPVYGSGGFTSYSQERLESQLAGWVEAGIPRVKMKVGRHPDADVARVLGVRKAVGDQVEVMVDANGAYDRAQALGFAERYGELRVGWFEEPVSSDDLDGLRLVRDRAPGGMEVAAGEYGWDPWYYYRLVAAGAVDVVQADVTRCGGITGFTQVAGLCQAANLGLSPHCAPHVSAHAGATVDALRPIEYFHDHVRVERLLFDGVGEPVDGCLVPDRSRPGLGIELKVADADRYRKEAV
ncbi:MAG: enolase C-terminal domain-like protein [Acidimicrobiales bacterium]